jgi:hypothetical protein
MKKIILALGLSTTALFAQTVTEHVVYENSFAAGTGVDLSDFSSDEYTLDPGFFYTGLSFRLDGFSGSGGIDLTVSGANLSEYDSLKVRYTVIPSQNNFGNPFGSHFGTSINWGMYLFGQAPNEGEMVTLDFTVNQNNIQAYHNDTATTTPILSPSGNSFEILNMEGAFSMSFAGAESGVTTEEAVLTHCSATYTDPGDIDNCIFDFPMMDNYVELNITYIKVTGYKTSVVNALDDQVSENAVLVGSFDILGQEVNTNTTGIVIEKYSDGSTIRVYRN